MPRSKNPSHTARRFGYRSILLSSLLFAGAVLAMPADDGKPEIIDATAMGTGTQLGRNVTVKLTISKF